MMTEIYTYLLIAVLFSLIGLFIGKLAAKLSFSKEKIVSEKEKSTLEARIVLLEETKGIAEDNFIELQKELKGMQREKEQLISDKSTLTSELQGLQLKLEENKQEVEKLNEKFTKEFENLANKILDEKSLKFTAQNKENPRQTRRMVLHFQSVSIDFRATTLPIQKHVRRRRNRARRGNLRCAASRFSEPAVHRRRWRRQLELRSRLQLSAEQP